MCEDGDVQRGERRSEVVNQFLEKTTCMVRDRKRRRDEEKHSLEDSSQSLVVALAQCTQPQLNDLLPIMQQ